MSNKWTHEYQSGESSVTFPFPSDDDDCSYLACVGSGTVVAVCKGGVVATLHPVGGEVYKGSFISLTSTTCTRLIAGNGPPPDMAPQTVGASAATSLDTRSSTSESVDTSQTSRVSVEESTRASAVTSLTTRFSTVDSTTTSSVVSLTSRVSVAESTEASKG